MSSPSSAYPVPVSELIPAAVRMVRDLGGIPSLNRLKDELRVGTDKARMVREALIAIHDATRHGGAEPLEAPPASTVEHDEPQPEHAVLLYEHERPESKRSMPTWPLFLLALPAAIAIWSGWVGLGGLAGFGIVHPLPGIADGVQLNTAITLPIGVETYGAFALRVWLSSGVPAMARRFAKWSAIGSLLLGALGQVAYHLMTAAGYREAPWPVTTLVAALPVAVLGMGAALAHLIRGVSSAE